MLTILLSNFHRNLKQNYFSHESIGNSYVLQPYKHNLIRVNFVNIIFTIIFAFYARRKCFTSSELNYFES